MNTLDFKEGQTYICTKSDRPWWTVGKEYPVFLYSDNEPAIKDDDGFDWHSGYLSYLNTSNIQFKLKEKQPKVTLDEPKKPVMPKFFDDWAKQVLEKRDKFYAISLITRAGWGYGVDYELDNGRAPSGTKELLNWIVENEGDDYPNKKKAVGALLHGYEVEKDPLYSVIIAGDYLVKEISCSNEVKLISTAYLPQYLAHHYQLTEKQIKAIDERFWPFAVPVEEE
ncbi:DUF1642 domain-containing protein [Enterococcus durans]|uniref:DUF1642 domain-containing protein n=2 Tax=Enterococcus durans TaxID=53345 RepID=A0AB36S8M3_9ENTE|nr:DUF1642 domain-containing protein [Enterococcus durans]EOT31721.1 hypothetical protein OMS_02234 [Enterococcus durans ATCC 6056]EOU18730.1 hypothetical protein I571_01727 [Enterococcus durans ATCC 6056]PEH45173.1 DUF1642 domain-containing protein [Enterococcus durans]